LVDMLVMMLVKTMAELKVMMKAAVMVDVMV
jgi:hypothetical protein